MKPDLTNNAEKQPSVLASLNSKDILDAITAGIVIINEKAIVISYNGEFKNLYPEIKNGVNFSKIIDELNEDYSKSLDSYLESNQSCFNLYLKHKQSFNLTITFKEINAQTDKKLFIGSVDIESNEHEFELLQQLIDTMPENIFIKDENFRFILANNWVAKIMGAKSPNELIGKTDFEFYPKKLAQLYNITEKEIVSTGKPLFNHKEKIVTEGKIRWYSSTKVPLYNKHGHINGIVGIGRDITNEVKEKRTLEKAKEEAEKADKLKSSFLSNLSHEIRTPLNGIIGFSQYLRKHTSDENPHFRFLDIIHNNGKHLLLLINNIIEVSMIESNEIPLKLRKFRINPILDQLKTNFDPAFKDNNKIEFSFSAGLPDNKDIIYSDDNKLHRIMNNLIDNAIKFTEKGKIEFGYTLENDSIKFFVTDTGIGINHDFIQEIFKPFRQVDESITRSYGGTGLGLTISKGLLKLLNGKIWVKSVPNKGSTFYFTLPIGPV